MNRLLDDIASEQPAPASGSAAAAVVAAAAALVEKSARLSVKHWAGAGDARERAHKLRLRSEELIEHDVHAYLGFVQAVRSAKGLAAKAREEAIDPARSRTVEIPLAIIQAAAETVALAASLAEHGNPNLRADAVVAAILATAAADSGAILIAVNLGDASGDPRMAKARELARSAHEKADPLLPNLG